LINQITQSLLLFATGVGIVFTWRGIWGLQDKYEIEPEISLIIGIWILIVLGIVKQRQIFKIFGMGDI